MEDKSPYQIFLRERRIKLAKFVKDNQEAIEECIIGRKNHGNSNPAYPSIIAQAREELQYSVTTASTDIFLMLQRYYDKLKAEKQIKPIKKIRTKEEIDSEEIAYLAGIEEGRRREKDSKYKEINYKDWLEL